MKAAIGYLRSDLSGMRQPWDEAQIRNLATKLKYDFRKTIVFNSGIEEKVRRLRVAIDRTHAAAIVVPSIGHFEHGIPKEILEVADVIAVDTGKVYNRVPAAAQ
ncbi:hypothetical protein [Nocardia jejuensis]|uniref:hypothetical protein n=1 Tax=Nocardia jejuensis TaxID=328049 RepID=UPI00083345E2|nr:hypothetical protein [Nocardia jejuensis]